MRSIAPIPFFLMSGFLTSFFLRLSVLRLYFLTPCLRIAGLFSSLLFAATFFSATLFAATPLAIQHVKLMGEPDFQVQFVLTQPAAVTMNIFNAQHQKIRQQTLGHLAAGLQQAKWDLRDDQQQWVPAEAYYVTLSATASDVTVVHDLSTKTGGKWLKVKAPIWDANLKTVRYRLSQPARVLLRVGLSNGGPLLATLVDRQLRAAGEHAETWQGMDAANHINLGAHPEHVFSIEARSLSENTWVVPASATPASPSTLLVGARDFPVRLLLPENLPMVQGIAQVSGKIPVRVQVTGEHQQHIMANRFEPSIFIDGVYVFENELGYLPMTWHWNTDSVPAGLHYLTINIRSYDGSFGVNTIKVNVVKPAIGKP